MNTASSSLEDPSTSPSKDRSASNAPCPPTPLTNSMILAVIPNEMIKKIIHKFFGTNLFDDDDESFFGTMTKKVFTILDAPMISPFAINKIAAPKPEMFTNERKE